MIALLLACVEPPSLDVRRAPTLAAEPTGDTGHTGDTSADPTPPVDTAGSPCPAGMVQIEGWCIDRWEAHVVDRSPYELPGDGAVASSAAGVVPQGYISGAIAAGACASAGKRLCTSLEWLRACQGPTGTTFPYGETYDPSACNDTRDEHPVVELFGSPTWSSAEMSDPRLNQLPDSLALTGANPACVSADGVYDLHGNLHEWVDDPDGTFRGGFYVDAALNGPGCTYATTAHTFDYHDYSTGFRCCADL